MPFTQSQAQGLSKDEIAQFANKLFEKKILNEKGKTDLINNGEYDIEHVVTMTDPPKAETLKTKKDKVTKEDILQFCVRAFASEFAYRSNKKNWKIEKRIKPEDSLRDHWTVSPFPLDMMEANLIHPSRSTIGSTRTRTLNDFLELSLIDSLTYNDAKQKLSELKIQTEVELLAYLYERQVFYTNYDSLKAEQIAYIKKLLDNGLLSSAVYKRLINSYKEYEIKSKQDIVTSCNKALRFDLAKYAADPTLIYPAIFDSIKNILPDFNYKDLTVKKFEKPGYDLIEETVQISFLADTVKYSHKFFHDFKRQTPDPNIKKEDNKISSDFHKGINKYLTDIDSKYRLHFIIFPDETSVYGQKEFGLILLTKDERGIIADDFDTYRFGAENYDQHLSSKKIKAFINEFNEQGFFKHLTNAEFEQGTELISNREINSIEDILDCFPKTLVVFDWETGNLENPYEEILKRFEATSRGAFYVSDIVDEYKKGWKKAKEVKFAFTLNGKRYEKLLRFKDDWLAPEFLELIKTALKENSIDGNIYYCIDNGQESGYIFLSDSQLKFIQTNYPQLLKD